MKLLLDQNISFRLVALLESYFPGTEQVKRLGLTNKTDREIWEYARRNDFVLVTFDSDFYDLSITLGHPPKLIWIKAGNLTTQYLGHLLITKSDQIGVFINEPDLSCLELK